MEKGVDKISAYYQHFDKQLEKGGPFFGGDSVSIDYRHPNDAVCFYSVRFIQFRCV